MLSNIRASLVAQRVKRLPAMRETQVRSLGREEFLEKEIAASYGSFIPSFHLYGNTKDHEYLKQT